MAHAPAPPSRASSAPPAGETDLRRRYVRFALWAGVVVQSAGLLDLGSPAAMQAIRLAGVAFALTCLGYLRRGGDPSRAGFAIAISFTVTTLAIALLRLPAEWSPNLSLLPAIVTLATLLVRPRLGAVLAVASIGVMVAAVAASPVRPPLVVPQLFNLAASLLLFQLFVSRLSRLLAAATSRLADSASRLSDLQAEVDRLSRLLSERISLALDGLERALSAGPAAASAAADEVARLLEEGKRSARGAQAIPDVPLTEELDALRLRVSEWSFAIAAIGTGQGLVRAAVEGTPLVAIHLLALAVTGALALIYWRRPALRRATYQALNVALLAYTSWILLYWYGQGPWVPPSASIMVLGAVISAVTIGLWSAAAWLATLLGLSMAALYLHPGVHPALIINIAITYGAVSLVVWRWPRDLVEVLELRRAEAAAGIRALRRLVATLFHDLSSPLTIVQAALGAGEGDVEEARAMVARMRATMAAAAGGPGRERVEPSRVVGELARLYRHRASRKGIELVVTGEAGAVAHCSEPVLRDSVLANLLSNAIKFSPPGSPIQLSCRPGPRGEVVVAIDDRGPGLPDDVREALERGEPARSSDGTGGEVGSGYGLWLARDYALSMGGRLELVAREGGGLSARVTLPAAGA